MPSLCYNLVADYARVTRRQGDKVAPYGHFVTLSSCRLIRTTIMAHDSIPVLDFGGQTAQLIVRRVRELGVYSELIPCDAPEETVRNLYPRGIILSGGPASVYEPGAPQLPSWLLTAGLPVLGICYGMQLQSYALG